ncbi:MAG TPA: Plug domain-containing protein [Longimicrobiales bacterium]
MKPHRLGGRRSGPARVAVGVMAVLGWAAVAQAQEPRPPARPDTTAAAPDSLALPKDSTAAADTLEPVDVVPRFPRGAAPSWRAGVWEWDRRALLASGAVSLTDLLERIPGIQPLRYGLYASPEAVNAWGLTGGRIEVVLDGFALDPLDAGTFDLSRIELAALERVRVERVAGRVRVELETIAPTDPRPYSRVEAGTGEPDNAKMFRGIFQAPRVLGGPLSLAVDRVDSDGLRRAEPANTFATWLKWARVAGNAALEFELRRASVDRQRADGSIVDGSRQDWVLRARGTPFERVTTEAYFGSSSIDEGLVAAADSMDGMRAKLSGVQAGVRAAFEADRGWSAAAVRLRSHEALPAVEMELAAGLRPIAPLDVSGTLSWSDWRGASAMTYGARAEIGPLLGFRPFAEAAGGRRGVPFLARADGGPVLTERTSIRVGGEFQRRGLRLGGAFVEVSADSVPTYGLPFDRGFGLFPGGDATGWELTGRIPLFWEPLALEGWYARWNAASPWIYLPRETWRAALVYSHSPLPSGNLDILARIEGRHRSEMTVPTGVAATAPVPGYTVFDAYLQLRVLTVWAFIGWENIFLTPGVQDFPGRDFPRQRVFYGVKWEFWN